MSTARWDRVAIAVLVGFIAMSAALIAVGRLIVGPLAGTSVIDWDARVERWFASHRTGRLNSVTLFWSRLADAPSIIAVGLVIAIALALRRHWHHIALLALALMAELGTFLTVSYIVGRDRPKVTHLGSLPSTGIGFFWCDLRNGLL